MKTIKLKSGETVTLSDKDYPLVKQYKWRLKKTVGSDLKYARSGPPEGPTIQMHRLIMGVTDPKIKVDHRDGNGLNNCRSNLRIATHQQNQRNAKLRKDNKLGIRGLYLWRGKIGVQITIDGKTKHLGYFTDLEEAVRVYNKAVKKHFGRFARLTVLTKEQLNDGLRAIGELEYGSSGMGLKR